MPLFPPGSVDSGFASQVFGCLNQPANATQNMGVYNAVATNNHIIAPIDCEIWAMGVDCDGNVTAGTIEFRPVIEGVQKAGAGEVLTVSTVAPIRYKAVVLSTPVQVTAGQRIGVQCVSVGLAPTTLDPVVNVYVRKKQ